MVEERWRWLLERGIKAARGGRGHGGIRLLASQGGDQRGFPIIGTGCCEGETVTRCFLNSCQACVVPHLHICSYCHQVIRATQRRHLLGKRGMSCLGEGGGESRINCGSCCRRDLLVPARPGPLRVPRVGCRPSGREAAVPSGPDDTCERRKLRKQRASSLSLVETIRAVTVCANQRSNKGQAAGGWKADVLRGGDTWLLGWG